MPEMGRTSTGIGQRYSLLGDFLELEHGDGCFFVIRSNQIHERTTELLLAFAPFPEGIERMRRAYRPIFSCL